MPTSGRYRLGISAAANARRDAFDIGLEDIRVTRTLL
jgi:hypothetical protein